MTSQVKLLTLNLGQEAEAGRVRQKRGRGRGQSAAPRVRARGPVNLQQLSRDGFWKHEYYNGAPKTRIRDFNRNNVALSSIFPKKEAEGMIAVDFLNKYCYDEVFQFIANGTNQYAKQEREAKSSKHKINLGWPCVPFSPGQSRF